MVNSTIRVNSETIKQTVSHLQTTRDEIGSEIDRYGEGVLSLPDVWQGAAGDSFREFASALLDKARKDCDAIDNLGRSVDGADIIFNQTDQNIASGLGGK